MALVGLLVEVQKQDLPNKHRYFTIEIIIIIIINAVELHLIMDPKSITLA
jgi:hypothetical protein